MWHSFSLCFIAIFVAMDVIGILPMYVSMTQSLSFEKKKNIINVSMWVAFFTALVFTLIGDKLFEFIGVTLHDFKIAGGLVLLLVSLAELLGRPESVQRASGSTGIVPLAVPLITGPAVLTTLILQVNLAGYAITILALVLNYMLCWLMLRHSHRVTRIIGNDGSVVLSKIVALLLAAIAIAMMRNGLFDAFTAFYSTLSSKSQ